MAKRVKQRKAKPERANTYKLICDNHPRKRAVFAFVDGKTGESRGLCADCFEEERLLAMRRLRIKRIRARRARSSRPLRA
jgi:hypothetical protein